MTTPSEIRAGLQAASADAQSDLRAVAAASEPSEVRAALFAATPLIVSEYTSGSAALALDWYEELREAVTTTASLFEPRPFVLVTDDTVAAIVAATTSSLRDAERDVQRDFEAALAESLELLEAETERVVVDAYTDTMTGNVAEDPDAVGWKRHARPEACKFCKMLAAKGAVYTRETARFAAHGAVMNGDRKGGNCMCIAGPEFGGQEIWGEASPMQYLALQKTRTPEQRIKLREYLNENFPDAPG